MKPFLSGFVDELTKVGSSQDRLLRKSITEPDDPTAEEIVSKTVRSSPKSYIRSALLGAAISPALSMISRRLSRVVHNRSLQRAFGRGAVDAAELEKSMRKGPFIGSGFGHEPNMAPTMTHADLVSDVATGALGGSLVQSLRDKLSSH